MRKWEFTEKLKKFCILPNSFFRRFKHYFDQNEVDPYETQKPKRSSNGRSSWPNKQFKIIWNVPSFQCHKYGLNFSFLTKYGIVVNQGDSFRGDQIALLYDPGLFPALLEANKGSDLVKRNGGVPQEGDLAQHLDLFAEQIQNKLIPDKDFSGKWRKWTSTRAIDNLSRLSLCIHKCSLFFFTIAPSAHVCN